MDLQLVSCVDKNKNDLRLYFHVEIDASSIWRPTAEDDDYFRDVEKAGSSSKSRVFVDPSAVDMTGEPLHVVNITWARPNK
ncbi:MAG: hypothetical protein AB7O52_04065 [Planctomycetota bacterium]